MILYTNPSSYYSMIGRYALLEAGITFETKRMDIHFAKDQLSPWYIAINPAMTVPALTNGTQSFINSRDILKFAATTASDKWLDADATCLPHIEQIIQAHYLIPIERLTFGKAMVKIAPLRFIFPRILGKVIRKLEADATHSANPSAIQAKIGLERIRIAYFTEGNRLDKLNIERERVKQFIKELPDPSLFLFGDKPSSADILTVILFARLQMIGEYHLVSATSKALVNWFLQMKTRPTYKAADIWTHFQPWRLMLKR